VVAVVLALVVLVPEFYTIGLSLSDSRPGTNAGRIHNDAPGYLGGQYTGMGLGLVVAVALVVLRWRWRRDRVLAREAKAARRSGRDNQPTPPTPPRRPPTEPRPRGQAAGGGPPAPAARPGG